MWVCGGVGCTSVGRASVGQCGCTSVGAGRVVLVWVRQRGPHKN
ncbi:hypothetical protein HMPREF1978_00244 [Actinomyces graevenitzii F0530]|uniref:Uncharacterized protein n=1 Tax=Actinomyces graevenitzii F0530 TaxID=1321817 RepID=U1RJD5_9ACTO|nr:hypothetical protein HMPREF1978_00244 [Actinomyces graevenitzii F0530]